MIPNKRDLNMSAVSDERITAGRPGQLDLEDVREMEVGAILVVHSGGCVYAVRFRGMGEEDGCEVIFTSMNPHIVTDVGMVPYGHGKWNARNWMRRATAEEVARLGSKAYLRLDAGGVT